MKRFIPFVFSFVLIVLFMVCMPSMVHAQGPDPCVDPDLYCPIDGGLTALLAIGAGYGIKKYRDARKSILDDKTVSE